MSRKDQSILIGGTGRSGTTILARVMGRHPDVHALRWETQFLTHPYGLVNLHRRGYRFRDSLVFLALMRGRWFRRVLRAGTPDAYEAGLCADVDRKHLKKSLWRYVRALCSFPANDAKRLQAGARLASELFEPAVRDSNASMWCEKTPSNALHFIELKEMFPHARFLHIVRDPRDVVCSMLHRNFWPIAPSSRVPGSETFRGKVTFEKAVAYWEGIIRAIEEDAATLGSALHTLRLEDLVAYPEQTIVELLQYLELRCDKQILDTMIRPANGKTGLLVPIHERRANINRWKSELDESQLEYLESRLAPLMRNYGYDPVIAGGGS